MAHNRLEIIDWLLRHSVSTQPVHPSSVREWKSIYDNEMGQWPETADRAVAAGFLADRVAYAFAGGYHSALQRLIPSIPVNAFPALCVSEKGGGHPGMIKTRLEKKYPVESGKPSWKLSGIKQFVTGAAEADLYLVAASTGAGEDGRNNIRLVQLRAGDPGATVEQLPALSFIPEIGHGVLQLKDVDIQETQFLPGDGYTEYVKPFRTMEDLHISAAILGYLFRTATRFDWPLSQKEQILGLFVAMRALTMDDPSAPGVHIALGGIYQLMDHLMTALEPSWESVDAGERKAWERDKTLMSFSKAVKTKRLASAWAQYGVH